MKKEKKLVQGCTEGGDSLEWGTYGNDDMLKS
jgi:hypothetical protein